MIHRSPARLTVMAGGYKRFFCSSAGACGAAAAVVATALCYLPAPALAQTADLPEGRAAQATRAEEDRARREAKATCSSSLSGARTRVLLQLDRRRPDPPSPFKYPPRGFHARLGSIGEGAGFGGGPSFFFIGVPWISGRPRPPPGEGLLHRRGGTALSGHAERESLHLGERPVRGGLRAAARVAAGGTFFGIGPGQPQGETGRTSRSGRRSLVSRRPPGEAT